MIKQQQCTHMRPNLFNMVISIDSFVWCHIDTWPSCSFSVYLAQSESRRPFHEANIGFVRVRYQHQNPIPPLRTCSCPSCQAARTGTGMTSIARHCRGLQAGGEAYSNWLFIAGETRNHRREVDVFEQMARTAHTRGQGNGRFFFALWKTIVFWDHHKAFHGQFLVQVVDHRKQKQVCKQPVGMPWLSDV